MKPKLATQEQPMAATTPRRVLVFGATGGTGRAVVEGALERGLEVTAFVRSADKLALSHKNLKLFVGDATDPADVQRAMAGHDAVLSAIGGPARSKARIRERATREQLGAMEEAGITRLISLSTYGTAETRETLPWFFKYLIVPFYLGRVFADHEEQEKLIRGSALDWTIVRPTTLTDTPATGAVLHGEGIDLAGRKIKVSRADVAEFMLDQLESPRYMRRAAALNAA